MSFLIIVYKKKYDKYILIYKIINIPVALVHKHLVDLLVFAFHSIELRRIKIYEKPSLWNNSKTISAPAILQT